jgi:hypothetical protein
MEIKFGGQWEVYQRCFIEWLSHRSPDTWHSVSQVIEPFFGNPVLCWIFSQPRCDKATAQAHIVQIGQYSMNVHGPSHVDWNLHYELTAAVVDRWNAKGFSRSQIASYKDMEIDWTSYQRAEEICRNSGLPWIVDRSIGKLLFGRTPQPIGGPRMKHDLRALFGLLHTSFPFADEQEVSEYRIWRAANGYYPMDRSDFAPDGAPVKPVLPNTVCRD